MKYDFRHIDPRTGLPKVIKNNEPEIQMMTRLPWKTGWIYLLQNRIGLNTVGNQRYKKKVWYDRRDCTVSTDETKEDAQHIRTAKFPNLGRPAGWIFASEIREFFNLKFTKSLNESKDIKDVKKGERIIFWTEDQLDLDDAWPAVGCMIFDKKGNPSLIGILNPIAHNEYCGYVSFDMISKWEYVDKVFPKGKTEDRLVQAISDSLVESLFNDDMFDDDEYHMYDKILEPEDVVDLGLPSGTKWATCNIGAKKPEEGGLFFQWGRTDGYKYNDTERNFLSKRDYTTTSGTEYKQRDTLKSEDDAAYQATNGKFRMPTKEEIEELLEHTYNELSELNGINGRKFISKKYKNKWVFIPSAGSYSTLSRFFHYFNETAYIWSATHGILDFVWGLHFYKDLYKDKCDTTNIICDYDAYPVRGVLNNKR